MPIGHRGSMIATKHLAIVLLLVSVSALTLQTPLSDLVHAQEPTQSVVTIEASGIAFRTDDGSTASATLSLEGTLQDVENEKLSDLRGTLQIGSMIYDISNGQGEADRQGIIEIIADVGSDQNLSLHGSNRNGDLVFNFPDSKLSSQYSLYLVGQLSFSNGKPFSPRSMNSPNSQSSSSSFTNQSTSEASFSVTQQEIESATVIQTIISAESITQPAAAAPPITQAGNCTAVVTVIANVTVTVTATSTVANVTITVHS